LGGIRATLFCYGGFLFGSDARKEAKGGEIAANAFLTQFISLRVVSDRLLTTRLHTLGLVRGFELTANRTVQVRNVKKGCLGSGPFVCTVSALCTYSTYILRVWPEKEILVIQFRAYSKVLGI